MKEEVFKHGDKVVFKSEYLMVEAYDRIDHILYTIAKGDSINADWDAILLPAHILPVGIYDQDYEFIRPTNANVHKGIPYEYIERFNVSNLAPYTQYEDYETIVRFQAQVTDDFDETGEITLVLVPNDGDLSRMGETVKTIKAHKQLCIHQAADKYVRNVLDVSTTMYTVDRYIYTKRIRSMRLEDDIFIPQLQLVDYNGSIWWANPKHFKLK